MLYKKNSSEKLSDELFRNPTAEYRGTPFWAWNTELEIGELKRQIEVFKKMGFGGFHIHVRTGLTTPYLSDEFMSLIMGCTEKAKEEDMLSWLYDEDRWSSGFAGGFVTGNENFRARSLVICDEPLSIYDNDSGEKKYSNIKLISCYDIELDSDGRILSYNKIGKDDKAIHKKWYAYLAVNPDSTWFNNTSYVDALNKKAIEKFIEITHERYKEVVGDEFDKTIPAIFTDEPQYMRVNMFKSSLESKEGKIPWTDDFPDSFSESFGFDILDYLPEIFWEKQKGEISKARYLYYDHLTERFVQAFADTIGKWCEDNNIHLTGHMMEEPSLLSQTSAIGEAMRSYRGFGLPGIDMLCAHFEFTTAKQALSAVNQFGREGMLSELYGVTGWDYDFRGYKLHGDWQACLGVSVRVPHLSWVAMGGEAKRDYPASISYQSPWWEQYSYLEDHFARINTLMTRGKPVVKIGVIHPIESYWLHMGPEDLTGEIRHLEDERFLNLTESLLKSSLDFDFISESLIPLLCKKDGPKFNMGEMNYDVVIVPQCESLRKTTIEKLSAFRNAGGKLIFIGNAPTVCDGEKSVAGKKLYDISERISYTKEAILEALEEYRTVRISENGKLTNGFIYRLKEDNGTYNLFISRACEPEDKNKVHPNNLIIEIKGEFYPVIYDTLSGEIYSCESERKEGSTFIERTLYDYDSLLLKLYKNEPGIAFERKEKICGCTTETPCKIKNFVMSEDNVYLIDMCSFSLDGGEVYPEEEILRLDNICRKKAGLKNRGGQVAQPWTLPKETPGHSITLIKEIESEIDYNGAFLAIEKPEECEISFNGIKVDANDVGYFTDKSIRKMPLPDIKKGINTLKVILPLGDRTNTEWMYILGKFGVKLNGRKAVITDYPDSISFGSITDLGFPFYGGNITYNIDIDKPGNYSVSAPVYYGALITAEFGGKDTGKIVYPPYELEFTADKPGTLSLTLYGNRANCFGPVHRVEQNGWIGPNAWRTDGDNWSYDYILKKIGIIEKPVIKKIK